MKVSNVAELIEDFIPSLPTAYCKLKEAMEDPESSFNDYADIISVDAGLTVRILKLVNSSLYGFSSRVETIDHALSIIGTNELHDLVLATSMVNAFQGVDEKLLKLSDFWKHNILCGLVARSIASAKMRSGVERYFVAGILHDIGIPVLSMRIPDLWKLALNQSNETGEPLYKAERKNLGYDHAEVGGALLKAWKLPPSLVVPVTFHHSNPFDTLEYHMEAAIVKLANIIVNDENFNLKEENYKPEPSNLLSVFNLGDEFWEILPKETFEKLDTISQAFL